MQDQLKGEHQKMKEEFTKNLWQRIDKILFYFEKQPSQMFYIVDVLKKITKLAKNTPVYLYTLLFGKNAGVVPTKNYHHRKLFS